MEKKNKREGKIGKRVQHCIPLNFRRYKVTSKMYITLLYKLPNVKSVLDVSTNQCRSILFVYVTKAISLKRLLMAILP